MRTKTIAILSLILLILAFVYIFFVPPQQQQIRQAGSTIGNCQVFPANNIWNYDISHLPVLRNSAQYTANIGMNNSLSHDFGNGTSGIPYNIVSSTQPYVPVHFNLYGSESDPGPYPIPPNPLIEKGSDRHVLVIDSGTCKLYELWEGSRGSDGSWNAGGGAVFNLNSNNLRPNGWGSADAAGFPITPGLVRYDEVATGAIKHTLRVVLNHPQHAYIWPARHTDGRTFDPKAPPDGTRFRLKASVDISSFSPQSRIILTALKKYGMFVADSGPLAMEISGTPDAHWDVSDLHSLSRIHASDFEAVDESSLQISPDSAQVALPSVSLRGGLYWFAVCLGISCAVLNAVLVLRVVRKYRSKPKQ